MKKPSPPTAKRSPRVSTGVNHAATVKKETLSQLELFESAIRHFHAREFSAAKSLFEQAAAGEQREVAHAARQHLKMCEQRLAVESPELRTAEDHYHYGITLISSRKLKEARAILSRAIEMAPRADHIQYAMGICLGLSGDLENAARHIEASIRLEPKNRTIARTDPDFLEFGRHSPVRELVFQEKKERDTQLPS